MTPTSQIRPALGPPAQDGGRSPFRGPRPRGLRRPTTVEGSSAGCVDYFRRRISAPRPPKASRDIVAGSGTVLSMTVKTSVLSTTSSVGSCQ